MNQKYQGFTKVKRAQIQASRMEFELLALKEGEKLDIFFGKTLTIMNKINPSNEIMEKCKVDLTMLFF